MKTIFKYPLWAGFMPAFLVNLKIVLDNPNDWAICWF